MRRILHVAAAALLAFAAAAVAAEPVSPLRFAVPWPPGSKAMTDLQAVARNLAQRTEDRVRLKFVEQFDLDAGTVPCDGALLLGEGLFRRSPAARVLALPRLARNAEEVAALFAALSGEIAADLEQADLQMIAGLDLGFAYLFAVRPVAVPEDLPALRFWTLPAEPGDLRIAESFGVKLVPLEVAAVRDALHDGKIDALLAPPLGAILMQWHVEVRHVLDLPLVDLAGVAALRRAAMERLTPSDRVLVRDVLAQAFAALAADARRQEPESLDVIALQGAGRATVAAGSAGRAAWDAWGVSVSDRLAAAGLVPAEPLALARRTLSSRRQEGGTEP